MAMHTIHNSLLKLKNLYFRILVYDISLLQYLATSDEHWKYTEYIF